MNVEDGQDAIARCHIKITLENEISCIGHSRLSKQLYSSRKISTRSARTIVAHVGSVTRDFLS